MKNDALYSLLATTAFAIILFTDVSVAKANQTHRIQQMQAQINALQNKLDRLKLAEKTPARTAPATIPIGQTARRSPLDPEGLRAYRVVGGEASSSQTAFNPSISVIVDGNFNRDSRQGKIGDVLEDTAGFSGGHHHHHNGGGHSHGHGGTRQGFSTPEAEIVFEASVDAYLDAMVVLHASDHGVEIEEAYGVTRSLPYGTKVKFGKFLSDVGYINRQHSHDWSFADRPLVNQLLFGEHGLQETGVQLSWVPPMDTYTRFGVELLQGETSGVANYEGSNERGFQKNVGGPRLVTAFAKVAPDLGDKHAVQFGVSGGYARKYQETERRSSRVIETDGRAYFVGVDAVYRYDAGGYMGHGNFRAQAEYFYRHKNYDLLVTPLTAPTRPAQAFDGSYTDKQDGVYAQAMYGIAPRWELGARYDGVGFRNKIGSQSLSASHRFTAALTFLPTEFSRFRLQYAHGDINTADMGNIVDVRGTERKSYNQVLLQYTLS